MRAHNQLLPMITKILNNKDYAKQMRINIEKIDKKEIKQEIRAIVKELLEHV